MRKLSNVTPGGVANAQLYRAVRGELPRAFWLPDEQGLVCAVDIAFMSASLKRDVPIRYMDPDGPNVLWVLQQGPPSDSGCHHGASIKMLSQFADEEANPWPVPPGVRTCDVRA